MGTTGLILSGQYVTPWPLVRSTLKNIPINLTNFLPHHNSILLTSIGFSCGNTTWCSLARDVEHEVMQHDTCRSSFEGHVMLLMSE
jgi:hypothetical protein